MRLARESDGEAVSRSLQWVRATTSRAGTWKVKLETDCTWTRSKDGSETTTKRSDSKEYTVNYTGEERGYRLSPLRTIKSPSSDDYRKSCSWTLTAPHADGDKVYSGSWVVPPGS